MLYVVAAVGLILISNAIAILVIRGGDVSSYVDIKEICDLLGEPSAQCAVHSIHAGWVACASALILLVLLSAVSRRFETPADYRRVGGTAFVLCAPLVLIVTALYALSEARHPLPLYRDEAFLWHGSIISLGNLVWPLLLQLSVVSSSWRWRLSFLSLVALILATSPFRGVFFAVGLFGILLPLLGQVIRQIRTFGVRSRSVAIPVAALSICVAAAIIQLALDTRQRPSNLAGGESAGIAAKLGQRVAIPLFQAHLAQTREFDPRMPTLADDILTKLRLRKALDFNNYLFAVTHGGIEFGEVTSLYFGEAAIRTTSDPMVWSVVAPFLLVLVWLTLRRLEVDASVLIGLAIWRGSLGGLVSVVPALTIQLALYLVICRLVERAGSNEV